jgi:hypothetical protein
MLPGPGREEVGAVRAAAGKAETPVLEDPDRGTAGRGGGGIAESLAEVVVVPVLEAGTVALGASSLSDRGLANPVWRCALRTSAGCIALRVRSCLAAIGLGSSVLA